MCVLNVSLHRNVGSVCLVIIYIFSVVVGNVSLMKCVQYCALALFHQIYRGDASTLYYRITFSSSVKTRQGINISPSHHFAAVANLSSNTADIII